MATLPVARRDIPDISQRFLLNYRLIACVDVRTSFINLSLILLMVQLGSTFLKKSIECWEEMFRQYGGRININFVPRTSFVFS